MPTFTVVPVEDAEGACSSTTAAAGSRPVSLGQIFERSGKEVQENDQEPLKGRNADTQEIMVTWRCIMRVQVV